MNKFRNAVLTFAFFPTPLVFGAICVYAMSTYQVQPPVVIEEAIESSWRLTEFGWQDSSRWGTESFVAQPHIELIHPVILTALIFIAVMATMTWASSEREVARLFGKE